MPGYASVSRPMLILVLCASGVALTPPGQARCKGPADVEGSIAAKATASAYDALGAYFGQSDNYGCAIVAFRNSLRLKSNSWQTRYYLALAMLAKGQPDQAAQQLRVALKINPDTPNARTTLGVALSQMHQTNAAIDEFSAALQSDPRSVTALDWLAKLLTSQSRYAAAIAVLKNAPSDEVLEMDLAIAYSQSGDDARAMDVLARDIQQFPASGALHSALATVYTRQRRYQEAALEFQEALRLDPNNETTQVSYLETLILLTDFKSAQPIAEEFLRRNSRQFEGLYLAGVINRQLGDYAKARERLALAVKLKPKHYDARYNLGFALAKSGKPAEARAQFEKSIELDPASSEAHFQLAGVLRSLSLPEEAKRQLELYQREIKRRAQKDEAAAKANQAKESLQKGEIQSAVDAYQEAAALDPKDPQMFYNFALALDRKKDYAKERESLEKAIELDPRFAQAQNQLGFLDMQANQLVAAEEHFKSAISLDPHYAEAQNNLGVLNGQKGNDAEAERLFRLAVKSNPGYEQAFVNLGVTLASRSHFAEADSALQRALELDPGNQEALEAIEMVKAEIGRRPDAR
jgi:tetratricopeptide (TPR) repeat protein